MILIGFAGFEIISINHSMEVNKLENTVVEIQEDI